MTAFEIVFTLLTLITSLALAHLLNGFVILLQHSERVRFSILHGLWGWIALAVLIGNWASFWGMRSVESWPALTVLLLLAAAVIEYAFCALVTPGMPKEGELNLDEFHTSTHRLYIGALVILLIISLFINLVLGGLKMYESWWHDSVLTFVAMLVSAIALFIHSKWVQIGVAVVNAAIVTYYLVISCNLVVA